MILIDRIEGSTAVCFHNGDRIDVPLEQISGNVREGVALNYCGGEYSVDDEMTELRKKEIIKKQNALFE